MIPGDLLSAFPHRQFHTLPGLLDSWAALPNSNPNACMPMQGGSLYHFYDGLWYDPAERRTHDLPCERRTRYRLSQPDTVYIKYMFVNNYSVYMIVNMHYVTLISLVYFLCYSIIIIRLLMHVGLTREVEMVTLPGRSAGHGGSSTAAPPRGK